MMKLNNELVLERLIQKLNDDTAQKLADALCYEKPWRFANRIIFNKYSIAKAVNRLQSETAHKVY